MSEIIELLLQLVSIDSINPDLVPGGAGEGNIARFVAHCCSMRTWILSEWLVWSGLMTPIS